MTRELIDAEGDLKMAEAKAKEAGAVVENPNQGVAVRWNVRYGPASISSGHKRTRIEAWMDNHNAKRQMSFNDSASHNGLRSNPSDAISALAEGEHLTIINAYNKQVGQAR